MPQLATLERSPRFDLGTVILGGCRTCRLLEAHPADLLLFSTTSTERLQRTMQLLHTPPWEGGAHLFDQFCGIQPFRLCPINGAN